MLIANTIAGVEDINQRRREALRRLFETRFAHNQAEMARAICRSPTTVWRLLHEDAHSKPLGEKLARDIERKLSLPTYYLDGVAQVVLPGMAVGDVAEELSPPVTVAVPLLNEAAAMDYLVEGKSVRGLASEVVFSTSQYNGRVIALRVHGDSMAPDFLPGDLLFIDPDERPVPGDIVVAHVKGDGLVQRKLRPISSALGTFELLAKNEDHPTIKSADSEIKIVGVVIEHHRYRKERNARGI